jgi:DHA1 family multidrug resistance protein-like MFS transporter
VRLASSNRLFQYPDEINPSLWKRSLPCREASPNENTNGSSSEKANGPTGEASDETTRFSSGPAHIVEGGKDIYLVDWYGPDDPEVIKSQIS